MGKKKYEFSVSLDVKELTEVPYGNGVFFAKLRLLDGGGGGFVAFSKKEAIVKNKVVWNWKSVFDAKLSSDDNGILANKFCRISIRREIIKWKVTSKKMGFFDINLAEHARGGLVPLKRILEAYDSKNMDNSMLHVTVEMKLMKGDPCYKVPNLSRVEEPYEDFETSGSNWYHDDIGSIRFRGAYDAAAADDLPANNKGDARIEYATDDDDDDDNDDDDDDDAFVTANDVSADPLESSRKLSFSSPDVARVGIEEFISPILSSPPNGRPCNVTSSSHHHYVSSTPPVRPRRLNKGGAGFRKKMSLDSTAAPHASNHTGGGGGAAAGSSSSPGSNMPPPGDSHPLPPSSAQQQLQHQQLQQQHSSASGATSATTTSSMERCSFKRTHKRDMSAGTKTTMLWLKASEEYAEERRRRADLPPCVSADDVVDDILQEFDMVKRSNLDRNPAEISGLKLSDVQ